jgi:hypothetical protein
LLNGKDGASTAAPEASTRFFTNSRRRIFTPALREEEIGGELSLPGRDLHMIGEKRNEMCERQVKKIFTIREC